MATRVKVITQTPIEQSPEEEDDDDDDGWTDGYMTDCGRR